MAGLVLLFVLALTGGFGPASAVERRAPSHAHLESQERYPFTLDFETGDLRGWTPTGNAFAFQPTLDDNPTARNRGQASNHQGRYWIGTYERYQGRRGQRPGDVQQDEPQGTLTSADFVVPAGSLSFLVGGGASFETRVELLVYDQIENVWTRAFHATGTETDSMRRVEWDLSDVQGRRGRLRIVDASSAGWGHINADDFTFSRPRPTPLDPRVVDPPRRLDPPVRVDPQASTVRVPDLTGREPAAARAILAESRLELGQVSSRLSPRPLGTITEQRPAADSLVPPGSVVNVVVAAGVRVPNLVGRRVAEIEAVLKEVGLTIGRQTPEPSERPTGTVTRQNPPADAEAPLNTPVNIVVAEGVGVPDLEGRLIGEAELLLSQLRLRLGEVRREPSDRAPGTVLGQSPGARVEVPLGSAVSVIVAAPVPVPALIGRAREIVDEVLAEARLELGAVTSRPSEQPPGTVIDQRPAPRTPVPLRTAVDIVVAEPVPVPNVVGEDSAEAGQRLTAARLRLGPVRRELSERATGTVTAQEPLAGTMVPLGTPVALVLAAPVPVPPVVGRTIREARQLIDGAQLAVGAVATQRAPATPGTVLRQTPGAGTQVPLRTAIDLVVAAGVPVPELVGRDSATAMDLLSVAELRPGAIESRPSPEPAGTVLEQNPVAGDQVALLSPVDLVIAAAVPVPDLLDLDDVGARELLAEVGLGLAAPRRKLSFKPGGTVLAQQPAPGSLVPLGTAVSVTVARHVPVEGVGAGLLTLLAASGLFVRTRVRRHRRDSAREEGSEAPGVEVHPHTDPGSQTLEADGEPSGDLEVRLRAVVDPGQQRIETPGSLFGGKRR